MPNTSISFPASPAVNQQYTYGTTTYVYTGTNWAVYVDSASLPSFVTSANIVDGTIVNADINASAAIDGSKISPIFTGTITTTGGVEAASLTVNAGTPAEKHVLTKVVKSIASLAPNTFRQESFSVSLGGIAGRHSVNFTAPLSFPAGIIAGPVSNGGTGTVYVALYNTSAVTVNFTASETYLFDVWQYA